MNFHAKLIRLYALIVCVHVTRAAKILAVMVIPSISHQIIFHPILRELSLRGHELTVITPNPVRDPTLSNFTEIDISFAQKPFDDLTKSYRESPKLSTWLVTVFQYVALSHLVEAELEHRPVKELINDKSKSFDVVLFEPQHPLLYGFGGRFRCPMVGMLSHFSDLNLHLAMGNPCHPITAPEVRLAYTESLNFLERLGSVLHSILSRTVYKLLVLVMGNTATKRHFGNDIGLLSDLEKNLSVMLINTHPLIHGIRPNVPTVVELNKIPKATTNQTLPADLTQYLNSATEGAIYFSLGSMMNSTMILRDKLEFIKETFDELPQKVIWKWDDDFLPGRPKNVLVKSWVPQMEVLKHPNVKVFITHGGPQSIEDALDARVPIIAIPLQFDQFSISHRVASFGIGKLLDIDSFDKQQFKGALEDVIANSRYKQKVEELAALVDDQPMDGLSTAIWWIEYVIRHQGAKHLRSPEADIPFYQYYFLDIIALVLLVVLITLYLMYKAAKVIMKSCGLKCVQHKFKTA